MLQFVKIEERSTKQESMITVFTDGACRDNGKARAQGSYAVVWPQHPYLNESRLLPCDGYHHTNNRAELMGVIMAIEIADAVIDPHQKRTLVVYTDSMLTINSLTKWMPSWKRAGWKKMTDKKPVANMDLLKKLDEMLSKRKTVFRHVRAHTNGKSFEAVHNDMVDKLAKNAIERNQSQVENFLKNA
jgi:ribonuclease HI